MKIGKRPGSAAICFSWVFVLGLWYPLPAPAASDAPRQDRVFSLVDDLGKPGSHQLTVFRDIYFGPGTACTLGYNLGISPVASYEFIKDPIEIKNAFKRNGWHIVNWHWLNGTSAIFAQNLPNLCSNTSQAAIAGNAARISSDKSGDAADTVVIGKHDFSMQIDSIPYYKKMFGYEYYPASNKVSWPILEISDNFPFRAIGNYKSLVLRFQAKLLNASVMHVPVDSPFPPPAGASMYYNPGVNATRLEMSLPLRWHPSFCTSAAGKKSAVCMKYFNKPLNVLIFFYDDRWEYWAKSAIASDPSTANFGDVFIYRVSPRDYIPGEPENNPFKQIGTTALFEGDILPLLKNIILTSEIKAKDDSRNYVPPRLQDGKEPETDREYLSHFTINSISLAYENSGLANLAYEIDELSLNGENR